MPARISAAAALVAAAALPAAASDSATFDAADRDRNGAVSESEFLGAFPFLSLEAMRMADTDRDGWLSEAEFVAASLPVGTGNAARPELPAPVAVAGQLTAIGEGFAIDFARILGPGSAAPGR